MWLSVTLIFFFFLGHGSPYGKSWGSPVFIDDVYLRNPMEPPDVLGMAQDPGPAPKLPDRKKSKLFFICVLLHVFILVPEPQLGL